MIRMLVCPPTAEARLPQAWNEIRADAATDDRAIVARYFSVGRGGDLPDRIGYLVGVRMIQQLRRTYSWPEFAQWTPEQAIAHIASGTLIS